ncbi:unnamed protein product [Lampetra planeri]
MVSRYSPVVFFIASLCSCASQPGWRAADGAATTSLDQQQRLSHDESLVSHLSRVSHAVTSNATTIGTRTTIGTSISSSSSDIGSSTLRGGADRSGGEAKELRVGSIRRWRRAMELAGAGPEAGRTELGNLRVLVASLAQENLRMGQEQRRNTAALLRLREASDKQLATIADTRKHMQALELRLKTMTGAENKGNVSTPDEGAQQLSAIAHRLEALPLRCQWGRKFGMYCFELLKQRRSFADAAQFCANRRGALAMVKDPATQRFLSGYIKQTQDTSYWIGLSDKAAEGAFAWVDGSPLRGAWRNFYAGEPAGETPNEDCVHITTSKYKHRWNDLDCRVMLPFICQY